MGGTGKGAPFPDFIRISTQESSGTLEAVPLPEGLPARERFLAALRHAVGRAAYHDSPVNEALHMGLYVSPAGRLYLLTAAKPQKKGGSAQAFSGEAERRHTEYVRGLFPLYTLYSGEGRLNRRIYRQKSGGFVLDSGRRLFPSPEARRTACSSIIRELYRRLDQAVALVRPGSPLSIANPRVHERFSILLDPEKAELVRSRLEDIAMGHASLEWEEALELPETARRRDDMETEGYWTPAQSGYRTFLALCCAENQNLWLAAGKNLKHGIEVNILEDEEEAGTTGTVRAGMLCLGSIPAPEGGWPKLPEGFPERIAWEKFRGEADIEAIVAEALSEGTLLRQDAGSAMRPADAPGEGPWL